MHGIRIAFVSDLHIRDITGNEYIDQISHMLGTARADILLMGGDYGETANSAIRFFNAIKWYDFPMGIFGVWGNNDVEAFENADALRDVFPGRLMINDMCEIRARGGRLMIGGLDELGYGAYPPKSLFPIANNSYSVLLAHYPKLHNTISGAQARLMLSGHTHGGQFRMLGLDPYSIGYEHGYIDSVCGVTQIGSTRLLTTNGVGVSKLPLRIGCKPQFHIIDFE